MSEQTTLGKQVPIEKLEAGKWYWTLQAEGYLFGIATKDEVAKRWKFILTKEGGPFLIFVLDTTFKDIQIDSFEYKGIRCLHEELVGYALVQDKHGVIIYNTFYEMEDSDDEGS